MEPALKKVESELGPIGILVNNAGNVSVSGGCMNEKPEDWDNVIETPTQCRLSAFEARRPVDAESKEGKDYQHWQHVLILWIRAGPLYSAAKGAIVQLTKSMAIELAPHKIQVNAIAPGWIETDMTVPVHTMPLNDEILARTPAGAGVNRRRLPEPPYTWPRGRPTS